MYPQTLYTDKGFSWLIRSFKSLNMKYKMKLSVDTRETCILSLLDFNEYTVETLPCGDFLFEDDQTRLLIERKTWADLHSSIQDGRFREQRSRLLEWKTHDSHRIMYLFEGQYSRDDTIDRVVHRLMIGYGIPVYQTQDQHDTVRWLRWVLGLKSLQPFVKTRDATQDRIENIRFSNNIKKVSIYNPKNMLISLLNSIHGISYPVAVALAAPYTSVQDFINRIEDLSYSEIWYERNNHKKKVSPKLIQKVVSYLCDIQSPVGDHQQIIPASSPNSTGI
jgi:ERCC4-type nuclease